ncbi:sigma factor binding protein 2, chloroplastic-like [Neltuma alba]|uniref:sigma factor binding protein 2, chloroplastic n=1 Tax=Neltuma alba TaxID=207710 RepID=UPI0010A2B863|nr:sigma factor binding protein 2, chloroplastic [Prosopis alba]XP_028761799.1 sigma factor binding protein 2, chloroplastic-like [Prosopis alba]
MDSSVLQRTPTKRSDKFKKKPIKVVYISNPMKVKVLPSEFMALVQELTGQDAELPADLSRFQNPDIDGGHQSSDSDHSLVTKSTGSHESDHTLVMPQVDPIFNNFEGQLGSSMGEGFDPFDHHVFAPDQMMDDISAFLPRGVFYESDLVDEEPSGNIDAV